MSHDPWFELVLPSTAATVSARRIDSEIPWDFFWARDAAGKCMLILKHSSTVALEGRLPKLKDIDITLSEYELGDQRKLIFRLLDSRHRDIFYRLSQDIVASASAVTTEKAAVEVAIRRTWCWHHLLRGGSDQRLSEEEQKGLIGELLVIERFLLPHFTALDAISAWHGPLDAPKDFAIGQICVEAKARRGGSAPSVAISSEHQLDDTDLEALFLSVVVLDFAAADSIGRFTVSEVADRLRSKIGIADPSVLDLYESRLIAAGFRWEHDYSDNAWIEGLCLLYRVAGQFPRICAREISAGVHHVKYSISLIECEPYRVTDAALITALKGT